MFLLHSDSYEFHVCIETRTKEMTVEIDSFINDLNPEFATGQEFWLCSYDPGDVLVVGFD